MQVPQETPFRESCRTGETPEPVSVPWGHPLLDRRGPSRTGVVAEAGGRDCCWYHGGDWDAVTRIAVRLITERESAGVGDDDELRAHVIDAARAEGVSTWALTALDSLLADPIAIHRADDERAASFVNGQHRTRAMRDAGMRAVLVGVDEPVEPTGPPRPLASDLTSPERAPGVRDLHRVPD